MRPAHARSAAHETMGMDGGARGGERKAAHLLTSLLIASPACSPRDHASRLVPRGLAPARRVRAARPAPWQGFCKSTRCGGATPPGRVLLLRPATISDAAAKGPRMCLTQIALGGTYQAHTPLTPGLPVCVEAIEVHHIGAYQCLAQVLRTALVWVYEPQRGLRYPVSPQALHPLPGSEPPPPHVPSQRPG